MFPLKINDNLRVLGNDYFHLYLIKGEKSCALIETGISATAGTVLEQLSSLSAKPDYLIITHPHSDHVTGLDDLKNAFPHATVIAGNGAESFISHPKAAPSFIAEDRHMLGAMASLGLCGSETAITTPPSLAGCKVVQDREELDLGELKIRFLEVKGHSPGNILVHIPLLNILLVSDSLGNHYPGRGFFPTFFTGYDDYMKTIDRLEKIAPDILGLAHNGLIADKKEIEKIFPVAHRCAHDVRNYVINDNRNDEDIAQDLFRFYYTGELAVYSPQNILNCCRLLVRRVREL
ncbi:MAG: MBL fold metallo-hydrolase [Smithella sp.]